MRFALVAVVVGLIGCANGGSDPASVVQGLDQQQIDQTTWLYNVETRDLVAADALQGVTDGFVQVEIRRFGEGGLLACEPGHTGIAVDVLMEGEVRPGHDGDVASPDINHDVARVGDATPGRRGIDGSHFTDAEDPTSAFEGFGRFNDDMLQSMQNEGFYAFHPGCA
jgi:hypothetical protein